jgi:S1-C subfamily serine protease
MSNRCQSLLVLTIAVVAWTVTLSASAEPGVDARWASVTPAIGLVITRSADHEPLEVGNGFFVGQSGQFVTTLSTLYGATTASVHMASGEVIEVDAVTSTDVRHNLALLYLGCRTAGGLEFGSAMPRAGDEVTLIASPIGLSSEPVAGVITDTHQTLDGGAFYLVSGPTGSWSLGAPTLTADGTLVGIASVAPQMKGGPMLVAPAREITALMAAADPEQPTSLTDLTRDGVESESVRVGLPGLGSMPAEAPARRRAGAGQRILTYFAVALFTAVGIEALDKMTE